MQNGLPQVRLEHPTISILIVSFNTRDVLRECLESVLLATGALG
jgi:GT2 family glycosyltransferase